jgi:hypothetical protein
MNDSLVKAQLKAYKQSLIRKLENPYLSMGQYSAIKVLIDNFEYITKQMNYVNNDKHIKYPI